MEEKKSTIRMNKDAFYNTSKFINKFCHRPGFLYINWRLQLPDLNQMENFCQIIKIQVSSRHHQVRKVE